MRSGAGGRRIASGGPTAKEQVIVLLGVSDSLDSLLKLATSQTLMLLRTRLFIRMISYISNISTVSFIGLRKLWPLSLW